MVVGLGNPGERYAKTRHNLGWMVLDELCANSGARLRRQRFVGVEAAEANADGVPLLLVRTASAYMNDSGPSIASFARKRSVPPERIIAVHDELDLPFGALRLKLGGSTAGHRGVDSLASALRSKDFYRVRIGIGRPPGRQDPADFVLEPFAAREREDAAVLVGDAADAVVALATEGLHAAQARFNRAGF